MPEKQEPSQQAYEVDDSEDIEEREEDENYNENDPLQSQLSQEYLIEKLNQHKSDIEKIEFQREKLSQSRENTPQRVTEKIQKPDFQISTLLNQREQILGKAANS